MPELSLPDGVYFSLANDVRARFGGQTRAHLMRNRFFTTYAGVDTNILTFDIPPVYPRERQRLTDRGELVPGMRLLNLFEYYRDTAVVEGPPLAESLPELPDLEPHDVPHPDGSVYYTAYQEPEIDEDVIRDYRRADGSVFLRAPAPKRKAGTSPYLLTDAQGRPVHRWPGKRGWGHHWLLELVGDAPRAFAISDSRLALLALLPFPDDRFHVLHLMHNVHLAEDRRWNSPFSPTYVPLFDQIDNLDALVCLTDRQRADVAQRLGDRNTLFTVSNPVALPPVPEPRPARDPNQFTIVSRFEPQKRLDRAIRVFARVVAERPQARLDLYGKGALGESLAALIAELDLGEHVRMKGWDPDARDSLWTSSGFLVTSAFEGYPLATLESLARGCPVVSYDIKYGPRDQITEGVDGFIVDEGDEQAMADRIVAMIDDPALVARLSDAALVKAGQHDYRVFVQAWNTALSAAVAQKADRASLTKVTCTVQRLGYRPVSLPSRAAKRVGRYLPVRPGSASLDKSRVLVLDAEVAVRGTWPKGALKRAKVTLDAVSATSEVVSSLPVKVSHTKGVLHVSSRFGLQRAFLDRDPDDRHVTLRLRVVLNNVSWETVLARPADAGPPYEVAYAPTGELQLFRGAAAPHSGVSMSRYGFVNSSRTHLAEQMRQFARETEPGMLVLDAGAGRSPYKHLFKHARYEAADFAQLSTDYAPLDYVCDLSDIPVEDERFDRIVFNQVLEHIPVPRRVLAELYRVLKPGGVILCSCPLFFPEHQRPYDYFRYTQYALRLLFEGAGFRIRSLEWLEGYFGTVGYQLQQMHRDLPRSAGTLTTGWRRVYLQPLLSLTRLLSGPLAAAFTRADVRWRYTAQGMPKNYVVLAVKPLKSPLLSLSKGAEPASLPEPVEGR